MFRPCNKCKGKGSYRYSKETGTPLSCSRCVGRGLPLGVMDRVTKQEKRERKQKTSGNVTNSYASITWLTLLRKEV